MIKGLSELLKKHRETEDMTEEQFEAELNKLLPETWKPASVYNELNEKYKLLETQKAEADKLLKEATEAGKGAEKLKADYEKLVEAQKADKAKFEADLLASKKAYAIDIELTKAGAKNNKAVKALLDDSKLILDEKGSLIGFTEQLEALKKDSAYLFDIKEEPTDKPAQQQKPSFGGSNPNTANAGANDDLRKVMGL